MGWLSCAWLVVAGEPSESDLVFFENRIRPLLADHCYSCHGTQAGKAKGGLQLDSFAGLLKGGDGGPALVPGQAERSPLIRAVRYTDPDLRMPPKGRKLSERQIADLTRWVDAGAPWPAGEVAAVPSVPSGVSTGGKGGVDRAWWAFEALRRPRVPGSGTGSESQHPIDAFIVEGMADRGLRPNPRATRRELIRRVSFDLIGLPPTPERVRTFEMDDRPDAWPRLVDELLSSPHYGERWGRHWLDVVRYAQSNGYERDGEKPESWRYRDYVVRAFNEDKPYDQFVREQLAGDELDVVTMDALVATGFQRLGVWDDEPDDKRMAEFDELDDVLSTTGSAFLGLTLGCARCHDHKFDPIPQSEYYSLLAFFRNLRPSEAAKYTADSANYVPLAEPSEWEAWQAGVKARLKPIQDQLAAATNEVDRKKLAKEVESLKGSQAPFDWALAVREHGAQPPSTHVLIRGNAGSPGAEVQPAFPAVLGATGSTAPKLPEPRRGAATSGRRRVLAEWITDPRHPLTARVMANRIWQHHFGQGLVRTTSDFGRSGMPPTHPALLDWLAAEFIEGAWSIKKLHRTILLSQTYQMSSRTADAGANEVDPGNSRLWRQNLRRLEAESLRDTMLAISGELNPRMGGRGFFPRLSGEVLAGQSRPGLDWEISPAPELTRRSIYAYVRRTMTVPMLDVFDYSNTTSPLNERPVTTVAPQSLILLNDEFMQQRAAALARRIRPGSPESEEDWIDRGFRLAVGRKASSAEVALAREFIERQEQAFASLRERVTFRPDVPSALSVSYLDKLAPEQFLVGPGAGWTYHRGRWSVPYEGIRALDRERGPFGLWTGAAFMNGVIETTLIPHTASESAGLLFRASAKEHELAGYELLFEPRESRLSLRRHGDAVTTISSVPVGIPTGRGMRVRVEAKADVIRAWVGESAAPVIDVRDSNPCLVAGRIGMRAWGAAASLDGLRARPEGGAEVSVGGGWTETPEERARQAFCLLLLNLNEVVYVD